MWCNETKLELSEACLEEAEWHCKHSCYLATLWGRFAFSGAGNLRYGEGKIVFDQLSLRKMRFYQEIHSGEGKGSPSLAPSNSTVNMRTFQSSSLFQTEAILNTVLLKISDKMWKTCTVCKTKNINQLEATAHKMCCLLLVTRCLSWKGWDSSSH